MEYLDLPVHRQETDVSGQSWGKQTYGPACFPAAASRWKARNHLTKKGKKTPEEWVKSSMSEEFMLLSILW